MMDTGQYINVLVIALVLLSLAQADRVDVWFSGELVLGEDTFSFEGTAELVHSEAGHSAVVQCKFQNFDNPWKLEIQADGSAKLTRDDGSEEGFNVPASILDRRKLEDLAPIVPQLLGKNAQYQLFAGSGDEGRMFEFDVWSFRESGGSKLVVRTGAVSPIEGLPRNVKAVFSRTASAHLAFAAKEEGH